MAGHAGPPPGRAPPPLRGPRGRICHDRAPLLPLPRRHGARAQRRRPPARLPAHAPLGAPLLALARRRVHGAGDTARRPDRARPARARAPDAAPRRRQGDLVAHLRGLLRALDARLHLPGQRAGRRLARAGRARRLGGRMGDRRGARGPRRHAPARGPRRARAARRAFPAGRRGHRPGCGPRALLRAPPSARPRGPPPRAARHRVRRGRVRAHAPLLAPRPGRARARARRLGHLPPRAAPAAPREPEAPRPHALLRAPGGLARRRLRRRLPPAEAARRAECRAPRCAARDMTDGAAVAHDVHGLAQVVVVGSGAGGAVVARELAARGRDVVLLEEGAYLTGKDFTGSPREMIDLLYRNRGLTMALGRPTIPIPLGRCVGGTTTINSGTCYRAPDYVLDEWAERYGVRGAREPDLRPYFERVEQELHVRPVPDETYGRNSTLFERGAAALGYAGARIPRNERGCLGTGVCAFGCPQDAKQAMHVSYVPRALDAGARLFTRCRVGPVPRSAGKAIGVVGRFVDRDDRETGHELRVLARHVVVACGALLTPALLERSAVPDPSGLRGRNLHIHPATRVGALFDEEVRGWEEVPQAYNVHHFTREGIFIQGQFVPPAMEAPVLPGVGTAHKEVMARYARLGSFGALVSDESAGRVRAGRGRFPRVTYQLGAADARKLARAIGLAAEIFFAAGAREVYSGVHSRPVLRAIDEARALQHATFPAADFEMMAFHPQGTARMGEDPRTAVTDSVGRVQGTPRLWVADASLFPSSCKVNPQITIMALATRLAEHLAAEL